jgi:hypothetical protein
MTLVGTLLGRLSLLLVGLSALGCALSLALASHSRRERSLLRCGRGLLSRRRRFNRIIVSKRV